VSIVRGGNGGDGVVSFLHTKEKEKAGPDGGDGGNGASVVFQADRNVKSLNKLASIIKAPNGEKGMHYNMRGRNGKDLVINVPVGTSFRLQNSTEVAGELRKHAATFVASRGGPGGKGNSYYLANNNRYPVQFEYGVLGDEYTYEIQLNIIADAILVRIY
jgi:GTP-binding protein